MTCHKTWVGLLGVLLVMITVGCGRDPLEDGWALFRAGDVDGAREHFEALARQGGRRSDAEVALGEIALNQMEFDAAAEHFTRASTADRSHVDAWVGYGEALLRSGRKREAYNAFLQALQQRGQGEHVPRIAGLLGDAYVTKRLTSSKWDNYSPSFTPDGSSILLTSHRYGNGEICRLDLATLETERLVEMPSTNEYGAHVSPDGRLLVFGSVQYRSLAGIARLQGSGSGSRNEILYVLDTQTGEQRALNASAGPVGNPKFSPDGSLIALEVISERNLDIWLMDTEGRNRKRITTGTEDDGQPMFNPSGDEIVFLQTQEESFELMSVRIDGSDLRQITHTPFHEYAGAFAPDGMHLVYIRQLEDAKELALMDWRTRRTRTLSRGPGNALEPAFSPDGTQIAFVSDRTHYLEIYFMDLGRPVSPETVERQLRAELRALERD